MVSGKSGEDGMVMDFGDLKRIVRERVIDMLDHTLLNTVEGLQVPTAENLCIWIWRRIEKKIVDADATLYSIRVWETPTSWAMLHYHQVRLAASFGELL